MAAFCSAFNIMNSSPFSAVYMSMNWVIIGLDNGLALKRRQAII